MENLYVMFKSDNKLLIEIKYDNYNKFNNIEGYNLIEIGKYSIGKTVYLKYMGDNFYKKILNNTFDVYREKNYIWIRKDS